MWVPGAGRPAGQAPGENVLQATLVDAQFGAVVDAGSIPAASTTKPPFGVAFSWSISRGATAGVLTPRGSREQAQLLLVTRPRGVNRGTSLAQS